MLEGDTGVKQFRGIPDSYGLGKWQTGDWLSPVSGATPLMLVLLQVALSSQCHNSVLPGIVFSRKAIECSLGFSSNCWESSTTTHVSDTSTSTTKGFKGSGCMRTSVVVKLLQGFLHCWVPGQALYYLFWAVTSLSVQFPESQNKELVKMSDPLQVLHHPGCWPVCYSCHFGLVHGDSVWADDVTQEWNGISVKLTFLPLNIELVS